MLKAGQINGLCQSAHLYRFACDQASRKVVVFFCGLILTQTNDHLYSFDQGPRVLSQFQQQVRQVHETDLQLAQVSTDQVSSTVLLKHTQILLKSRVEK